jgi:hypothetical protein
MCHFYDNSANMKVNQKLSCYFCTVLCWYFEWWILFFLSCFRGHLVCYWKGCHVPSFTCMPEGGGGGGYPRLISHTYLLLCLRCGEMMVQYLQSQYLHYPMSSQSHHLDLVPIRRWNHCRILQSHNWYLKYKYLNKIFIIVEKFNI